MLILFPEKVYSDFKAVWDDEASKSGVAIRKVLRISYYLLKHVWGVDDVTISEAMNDVQMPEGVSARKFRHDWVKPFVAIGLDGRDLAERERTDNVHDYPKGRRFDASDAWRFMQAVKGIATESEAPLTLLTALSSKRDERVKQVETLLSPKIGAKTKGDVNMKRLEAVKKTKGSFLDHIRKVFDGILEDVHLGVEFDDETVLALSLVVRRIVEKEVELLLLTNATQGDGFDLHAYLQSRVESTDVERSGFCPAEIEDVLRYLRDGDSESLDSLLGKIQVA